MGSASKKTRAAICPGVDSQVPIAAIILALHAQPTFQVGEVYFRLFGSRVLPYPHAADEAALIVARFYLQHLQPVVHDRPKQLEINSPVLIPPSVCSGLILLSIASPDHFGGDSNG